MRKNWQFFFFCPKRLKAFFCPKRFHLLMCGTWRRVTIWGSYMVFWQNKKTCFSIILQVKKENWKIDFYSNKKVFTRSGNCKLLLNQRYMLFIITINFYIPCFSIVTSLLNLIVNLTLSWRRPLSYRNQSIDLLCKSMECFLYDNGLRHERVKRLAVSSQGVTSLVQIMITIVGKSFITLINVSPCP